MAIVATNGTVLLILEFPPPSHYGGVGSGDRVDCFVAVPIVKNYRSVASASIYVAANPLIYINSDIGQQQLMSQFIQFICNTAHKL